MTDYLKQHTCEMCGAEFIGGNRAKYCLECRKKRDREIQRTFREKERERESGNEPEGAEPKPTQPRKKAKGPNTKQCRGCSYWQRVTGVGGVTHCCHYNLHTRKQRERDGDRCLSRTTKAVKPNTSPWPAYQTGDSIYAGYK